MIMQRCFCRRVLLLGVFITTVGYASCSLCYTTRYFGEDDPETKYHLIDSNTGMGYLMSDTVDCCGVVDTWIGNFANVVGPINISFEVWRPTSGNTYKLVAEDEYTITSDGEHIFSIGASDRVTVISGDKFGWWTSGADIITYTSGYHQTNNNRLFSITDKAVGDTQNWGGASVINSRTYAARMDVEPNDGPSFTNIPDSTSILNNVGSSYSIFTVGVDDVNPDDVSLLSVTMTANSQLSFDTATLELSTGILNGGSSTEVLVFEVADVCGSTATASYTVTIVNDPPTIHNLPASASISEDEIVETLLYTINVTDSGNAVTCNLATSVPASYPFVVKTISSTSDYGIYSESIPGFNYSDISSYALAIDCTDTLSTVSGVFTVSIIPNIAPVIVNLQNSTSLSTTAAVGTVVFTVKSTDTEGDTLSYTLTCSPTPCPFQIFSSGRIYLTEDIANHTTLGYDIYVTVADAKGSDGPKTLTVTITDLNYPVSISNLPLGSALLVAENTALGTSIYTVSYTDLDTSQPHAFYMTSSPLVGASYFSIDSSTGLITTSGSITNYELMSRTSFTFSVTVTDPVTSDTEILRINVVDENEAPVFSPTSYSTSIQETSKSVVVANASTFGLIDPDNGDTTTLVMDCGDSNGYFYLDATDVIRTFSGGYDADTLPSTVVCNVTATDTGYLTAMLALTINIENTNDNTPRFVPSSYTFFVSYYAQSGTLVGNTTATDADIGALGTCTYSIQNSQYFTIDNSGVIVVQQTPEGSSAHNYSTSAVIIAVATDSGDRWHSASVTIVVSGTTTAAPTTTQSHKTFTDDPRNWAWLVPLGFVVAAILGMLCYLAVTCHGENGCDAFTRKLEMRREMKKRLKETNREDSPGSGPEDSPASTSAGNNQLATGGRFNSDVWCDSNFPEDGFLKKDTDNEKLVHSQLLHIREV